MSRVTMDDFKKLDLRVGRVASAEPVPGSRKLLRLIVDLGGETRQIVAGLAERYRPEELVGKLVIIVANLEPKRIMGIESQGMLLATCDTATIISPSGDAKPGERVC